MKCQQNEYKCRNNYTLLKTQRIVSTIVVVNVYVFREFQRYSIKIDDKTYTAYDESLTEIKN